MRILLIEDDQSNADSVKLTFYNESIICDHASFGVEGLERVDQYNYDLIILDLILPDIDGYELLLKLKAEEPMLPVLILSGLSSEDQKIKAYGFGADGYLAKPFNNKELVARAGAIM